MTSYWYNNTVITGLNAQAALLNGGTLNIYSGSQPTLGTAPTSGNLLVSLAFSATAFPTATASGGTVTAAANTITSGTATAAGTAGYFALLDSSGATVLTGTVGLSGADLNLSSLTISVGTVVSCSAFSLTQSQSGS